MVEKIFVVLFNPDNSNFWDAWSLIVAIFIPLATFFGWIISKIFNNSINKTTQTLIKATVEIYLDWVKRDSKSKTVDNESIKIFMSENKGSIYTGRSYLIFKRFIKELKKQGYKSIYLPEENMIQLQNGEGQNGSF
ncbi:hypothetical protein [Paenimyroides baculatum]|uniref:Uncharacterized protein n=1 Tax=Paenimyroides baculatum TaxID=2608000 RepID=A0A5M6CAA9_9FLAO|nr:hypothetical protein [Paenimyroides baculatum]KAA5531921.1 hypothetical protein F0460_14365 [Paenimyroides baculatum]